MFWLNTFGIFIAILNALDSKFQFQGVVIQVQVPKCEKEFQQWLETMDSICFWVIVLNSVVENRSNAFASSLAVFSVFYSMDSALSTHSPSVHHSFCHPFESNHDLGQKILLWSKGVQLCKENSSSKKSPNLPGACKVLVNTFVTLTTALFSLRISLRFFLSSLSF